MARSKKLQVCLASNFVMFRLRAWVVPNAGTATTTDVTADVQIAGIERRSAAESNCLYVLTLVVRLLIVDYNTLADHQK